MAELKKTSASVQTIYNQLFTTFTTPKVSVQPDYSTKTETQFIVTARTKNAQKVLAQFTQHDGQILTTIELFDNGVPPDSLADDQVFVGRWVTPTQQHGLALNLLTVRSPGDTITWPRIVERIPTFGPVEGLQLVVGSDNINSNGQVNPGENLRFTVQVGNGGPFPLQNLKIRLQSPSPWVTIQDPAIFVQSLAASDTVTTSYDLNNPDTYFAVQFAPEVPPGTVIPFHLLFYDTHFNHWQNDVAVVVQAFPAIPEKQLVEHIAGPGQGTFGLYIVDPQALTGHTYRITISDSFFIQYRDSIRVPLFNLIDQTTGATLLRRHPIPDEFSHNVPVIHGFKLTRGTLVLDFGLDQFLEVAFAGQPVDPPVPVWHQPNSNGSYALSAGGGLGDLNRVLRSNNIKNAKNHDIEIRFTERGSIGWWYFDNNEVAPIPLELWDIGAATPEDTSDDKRLIPLLFSGYGTPGVYDLAITENFFGLPATDWLYIYTGDYEAFQQDAQDGILDNDYTEREILARLVFVDLDQDGQIPPPGTTVRITTLKPPTTRDLYQFVPVYTGVEEHPDNLIPQKFELFQNYPNPFNPGTTIRYHLPVKTQVKLTIYNILGQEVITLVDKVQPPGKCAVQWDGKSASGQAVASGIYFYQLKTKQFTQVKKLLLVR